VVLAGVNGAGKSSILGAALRQAGGEYHNPDEVARRLLESGDARDPEGVSSQAWELGRRNLERAIAWRIDFGLETTLGGESISRLLVEAAEAGHEVWMIYVGLDSPELHQKRVRSRVARGGHHIPDQKIAERFDASRKNLIRLLPFLTSLRLLDNSQEADPSAGLRPEPMEVLRIEAGRIGYCCPLDQVPGWARPVVAAALKAFPVAGQG
jgi:predicted ABC-type ATPase